MRADEIYAPRLVRTGRGDSLVAPAGERVWRLDIARKGTFENLTLVAADETVAPLEAGQVRVAVRAAGLNFRDVLVALGIYPGEATVGSEGAGVVLEVGEDVSDFAPGDRVMGLMADAFGPVAVTDHRLVVRIPEGWSFIEAASAPIVFLTAYYALVDLANVESGGCAARACRRRRGRDGGGAAREPYRGRGICDCEPRQVAGAQGSRCRRGASRFLA